MGRVQFDETLGVTTGSRPFTQAQSGLRVRTEVDIHGKQSPQASAVVRYCFFFAGRHGYFGSCDPSRHDAGIVAA